MDIKSYSLFIIKESGLLVYQLFFCSMDFIQNLEMILVVDYDKVLGCLYNVQVQFDYNIGFFCSLMEDYLVVKDGYIEYFY